jgi:hypothetical protein
MKNTALDQFIQGLDVSVFPEFPFIELGRDCLEGGTT